MHRATKIATTSWAIAGFSLLLLWAIVRLSVIAAAALQMNLQPGHWLVLIANCAFMAWSEGYRGFQRSYAPRFAARVEQLRERTDPWSRWLAPLYAMGLFADRPARLRATYLLTAAIIVLVLLFQLIPQPWRGVLDAGVVVGLSWGLLACWWHCYRTLNTPVSLREA